MKEESKYIHEQVQKELDQQELEKKKEKIRANKNKMQDQFMAVHFEALKKHRVWE